MHSHGRWISRLTLVLALLWPLALVALDHFGAERVPGHEHPAQIGEPIPAHLHGFQLTHGHAQWPVAAPGPAFVPPQTAAAMAVSGLQYVGIPILAVVVMLGGLRRIGAPVQLSRGDQITMGPPTPPPTCALSFC